MAGSPRPQTIDVAKLINERKLGAFNYKLIALSWLITVFDGFDMMMISYTAPYMQDELGLDKIMLGKVFSAGMFGMMVGGFLFAYIGDRIGRRQTIIVAAFAFGILTTATGFAQTYEQLLLLRFLDGIAIGGMLPLAWALNIEFVPSKYRSTVVTVIMMGYSIGTAIAAPITVWLADPSNLNLGWEGVFIAGGLATLVCAVALWWGLPESVRLLVSKQRDPERIAATLNKIDPSLNATASDHFILGDEKADQTGGFRIGKLFEGDLKWLTPLLWTGYIASTLAVYFKANWGPIVYEELGFARTTAAYASSVGGLLGALFGLLLMRFTDGKGPAAVAVFPLIAIPPLLALGLIPMTQDTFLPLSILSSALVGGAHFGVHSIAGIFYMSSIRATGAGWATSIAKIGGIAGPIIGGYVLSSGLPIVYTFAVLAACPALLAGSAIAIGAIVNRRPTPPPIPAEPVPAT